MIPVIACRLEPVNKLRLCFDGTLKKSLIQCPFCGSARLDLLMWHISCSDCGARTRDLTPDDLKRMPTTAKRIEGMLMLWNKRTPAILKEIRLKPFKMYSDAELLSLLLEIGQLEVNRLKLILKHNPDVSRDGLPKRPC